MDCENCKTLQAQIENLKKQLAQKTPNDVQFVDVEKDTFAEAFTWSIAEAGRRHPGAIGTIEHLKSLIQQYLAAKGINYVK